MEKIMQALTEEQAKTKFCPSLISARSVESHKCLASGCMAWLFYPPSLKDGIDKDWFGFCTKYGVEQ